MEILCWTLTRKINVRLSLFVIVSCCGCCCCRWLAGKCSHRIGCCLSPPSIFLSLSFSLNRSQLLLKPISIWCIVSLSLFFSLFIFFVRLVGPSLRWVSIYCWVCFRMVVEATMTVMVVVVHLLSLLFVVRSFKIVVARRSCLLLLLLYYCSFVGFVKKVSLKSWILYFSSTILFSRAHSLARSLSLAIFSFIFVVLLTIW